MPENVHCDPIGLNGPILRQPELPTNDATILIAAQRICETALGPNASESDRMTGPNPANFKALAEAGLLGLTLPREWGGLDASGKAQRDYTELIASYCGVTTFIQAQHHGPSRMLLGSPNEALKRRLLSELASGRLMSGISFAHLRRPGPPVLSATPAQGGWVLNGVAPWVTGWGMIGQVVFGATLPDGRFVYLWSPVRREDFPELFADISLPDSGGGELNASPSLPLCAMNASATVEATCRNWFIPQAHWLSESDRETMQRNDRNGALGATAMPLGCAAAAIRVLCETAERRSMPAIRRASTSFTHEWEEVKGLTEAQYSRSGEPDFFATAIKLRAWCIEIAERASLAAVAASSGSANSLTHPAQRLLREAMFYSIQAQTSDVMDATLARFERS